MGDVRFYGESVLFSDDGKVAMGPDCCCDCMLLTRCPPESVDCCSLLVDAGPPKKVCCWSPSVQLCCTLAIAGMHRTTKDPASPAQPYTASWLGIEQCIGSFASGTFNQFPWCGSTGAAEERTRISCGGYTAYYPSQKSHTALMHNAKFIASADGAGGVKWSVWLSLARVDGSDLWGAPTEILGVRFEITGSTCCPSGLTMTVAEISDNSGLFTGGWFDMGTWTVTDFTLTDNHCCWDASIPWVDDFGVTQYGQCATTWGGCGDPGPSNDCDDCEESGGDGWPDTFRAQASGLLEQGDVVLLSDSRGSACYTVTDDTASCADAVDISSMFTSSDVYGNCATCLGDL